MKSIILVQSVKRKKKKWIIGTQNIIYRDIEINNNDI